MYLKQVFLPLFVIASWSYYVEGSLYNETDGVEILTPKNINSTILRSEYDWLVEFYRSSCGHCRRYSVVMKNFSDDIDTWKDLVKIGTIDCDIYAQTCKNYHVRRYPTFRYFHPNQINGVGRPITALESSDSVDTTRHKLVNVLITEQHVKRKHNFPPIQPYRGDDLKELINESGRQYVLLSIERPESTLGAELALYFHTVPEIIIRYSHNNNAPLLKKLRPKTDPSLYVISSGGKHEALTAYGTDTKAFKEAVERFLRSKGFKVPAGHKHNHSKEDNENKELIEYVKSMGDRVYLGDLESAIRFSLTNEVFAKDDLTKLETETLLLFIQLVKKYVPMTTRGETLMEDIERYLEHSNKLTGATIKQMVEKKDVFLTDQKWIGCVGQSEAYRGYPCSLWKLFHYLTVNAALDPSFPFSNENAVLEGMHHYIKFFFTCEECKRHFLKMAKRRQITQVATRKDAVLWLWEAHNEVNNRLHGDVTEDRNFPKVQFPLAKDCPKCRNDIGVFDRSEVAKYLFNMYTKQHVVNIKI